MINDENLIVLLLTLLARESAILNTAESLRRYVLSFFKDWSLLWGGKKEKKTELVHSISHCTAEMDLSSEIHMIYNIPYHRWATPWGTAEIQIVNSTSGVLCIAKM